MFPVRMREGVNRRANIKKKEITQKGGIDSLLGIKRGFTKDVSRNPKVMKK